MDAEVRMTVRLPRWAADYLDRAGRENFTSRNAEIVRSVKERMKAAGAEFADQSPAAESNEAALQGGPSITSGIGGAKDECPNG